MDNSKYADNAPQIAPTGSMTGVEEQLLDNHLMRIRKLMIEEAIRIANDRGAMSPEELDVAEAARRFAPGKKFPPRDPQLWERFKGSLSGITLVSAVLAVVFGILGALVGGEHLANASAGTAYFDIAKLFAGAIVGSTGAGVVVGARRE